VENEGRLRGRCGYLLDAADAPMAVPPATPSMPPNRRRSDRAAV